jgi:AAA ATPase domain
VLVGRRDELRQIGGLLAAVKRGRSGALVLVGEPGIGKSALLEETVRHARGMRILRASGIESESELPYAGLLTLTRPVAGLVRRYPSRRHKHSPPRSRSVLRRRPTPWLSAPPRSACSLRRRSTSRCSRLWTSANAFTTRLHGSPRRFEKARTRILQSKP